MNIISIKSVAKQLNDITFTDYFYRLQLLARSVFKWDGLPNCMNEKWIEWLLFNEGQCVFFKHPSVGFMVAKFTGDSVNEYGEPTTITTVTTNIESVQLEVGKNCVIIRNNDAILPTRIPIELFAYRLAEISRTIDINVNAQKTPVLILTNDKQKLTMKNVFSQWNGYEPVIYGDKTLDVDSIRALKIDAPVAFPDLQVQKHSIWNEALTFMGINNANTDKRERQITDEVNANNEHIDLSAHCFLKSREFGCEEIHRLWPELNIKVTLRREVEECTQDTQNI